MTDSVAASLARPVFRLRGPADLVDAIPYLLGFHPEDSLVIAALTDGGRRLGVVIRADLDRIGEFASFALDVAARLASDGAHAAVAVIYGGVVAHPQPRHLRLLDAVAAALTHVHVPLADALHVTAGRWRSLACDDSGCCPPAGTPLADAQASVIAATAAAAGLVALPDRGTLQRSLQPSGEGSAVALRGALERAEIGVLRSVAAAGGASRWRADMRPRFAAAIAADGERRASQPTPGWLPDDEAAELLVALVDVGVRDDCWQEIDREGGARSLSLWWQLSRRAVPPYDSAPLFLLAWAAWRTGDGAVARIAAERSAASDPGYRAAQLLLAVLDRGVDPRALPSLAVPARCDAARRARR